jgi:hypothetical protein
LEILIILLSGKEQTSQFKIQGIGEKKKEVLNHLPRWTCGLSQSIIALISR